MTFTPTPEQDACVEAAKETADNLIISALAGAAKTSTLVLLANALKREPILSLAFNKKIADEMDKRLPGNCTSMTLNSLGHRAWAQATGRRLVVDSRKSGNILKALIDELPKPKKEAAWESFGDLLRAIESGKSAGYIPTGHYPDAKPLHGDDSFFAHLEKEPTALEEELIAKVTLESIRLGFQGMIDFSDQILLPTVFPCSFPQFPLVMIDEAQDLSPLNRRTLKKLVKKRLIAVGDACQAIYGFRGADHSGMDNLEREFGMCKLGLSVSFRCPRTVVEHARWRAPHMQYPEWAKEGAVVQKAEWGLADIPAEAAIICRNNAPLFALAIRILKAGRYPKVLGNDIGRALKTKMKKLGDTSMTQVELLDAIDRWEQKEMQRSRIPKTLTDQAECMRIFAAEGETLGAALAYADHVMNSSGPIQLMTGHKSKGLEFDHVFFLDEHLVSDEGQDPNLRYVIQTRTKETLTYVDSELFGE